MIASEMTLRKHCIVLGIKGTQNSAKFNVSLVKSHFKSLCIVIRPPNVIIPNVMNDNVTTENN